MSRAWKSNPAAVLSALLLAAPGAQAEEPPAPSALGGPAGEFVYTPVVPCRIADTRQAGGSLAPGAPRDLKVTGSGLQGQGGNPAGCGVPAGPARSAIINFVAVNPAGPGNLRVWAYSEPPLAPPTASILNYTSGLNLANGIAVPLCDAGATTCNFDIKVQADASGAHLVADVVGYFSPAVDFSLPWANVVSKPAGFADGVDNDTLYSNGFGLNLVGNTFSVIPGTIQRRVVGGGCTPGNSIRLIAEDGTVTCELDDVGTGDITEIATAANSGLTGGVTAGTANLAVDPTDFNGAAPIVDGHVAAVTVPIGATFTTLRSVTVTVPAGAASGGHIAVMGVSNVNCTDATCPPAPTTTGQVGFDHDTDGAPANLRTWSNGPAGPQTVAAIDQFLFTVPGTYTLHLRASCLGPGSCHYTNISVVAFFIPR
jgi:hypothetical protein